MSALKKEEAGIKLPKMQLFNVRGRRFFKTDKNVQTCVVYNAVVEWSLKWLHLENIYHVHEMYVEEKFVKNLPDLK